jgi:hypothetical protein
MQNQSVEVPFLILSAFSLGDKAEIEGVRPWSWWRAEKKDQLFEEEL